MTELHVIIIKVAMVAGAVALATTFPAHACKVVGYANGEPLCATTSDTGRESYTDGRYQRSPGYWRWQRAQRARVAAEQRGRNDWQNNGIDGGAVGVISPYVPGSNEWNGWCAERKAHGMRC